VTDVLAHLRRETLARATFVVDGDGEILAADGDAGTLLESLGHAAVERIDAAEGLAAQLDSPDFGVVFDVAGKNVYVSALGEDRTLGILFDESRTSLGTIRLRVKALHDELVREASNL
jgi:predicted regulator of Ras-like GTPase activity (Roadblock/LC7/MglB family)